jgi:glycosyltransferase involved in cell wall biosynthesis
LANGKGIVLYDFLLVRGGAERLTLTLVRGLEDVDLCVGYRAPERVPDGELEGINCIDLAAATNIAGWRSIKVMRAFRYRTRFLSEYDWVLYSGTNAPLAVYNHPNGANILYCHTLPRFVYDLREYYLERYPRLLRPALKGLMSYVKPRYEAAVARMDLIIVNSENVRQRMRRYLNRDSIVINPPCDTDKFVWRGQSDYYVSSARLECFKRVDVIVDAFLRMPDKRLIVASGGSESARLRRLAARADNIQFAGWLDDAALQDLMGHSIATIYIPKDEDFGMSPVESMAAGKPVIGVAEGGLLETVVDGETGTLLRPNPDADDVIEAVQYLTAERALQMRYACESRAALFSRDRFLSRMREVIYGVRG